LSLLYFTEYFKFFVKQKQNDFSIIPSDLVPQMEFELSLYPSENQYLLKHLNQ